MEWTTTVAGWGVATVVAFVCLNCAFGAGQALISRIRRAHRPGSFAMLLIVVWLCCVVALVMSAWALATAAVLDAPVLLTIGQRVLDLMLWPFLLGSPWIMRLLRASGGLPDVPDAG